MCLFYPGFWVMFQEKARPFLATFVGTFGEAFDVINFSVLEC